MTTPDDTPLRIADITEVRVGGTLRNSSYPNAQMKRLLSGVRLPWYRRLLRWFKGVGR